MLDDISTKAQAQLREDIENLALHLALWDESSGAPAEAAIEILNRVSQIAGTTGAESVVQAAYRLRGAIRATLEWPAASAEGPGPAGWREDLRHLQSVYEPPRIPVERPSSLSRDSELVSDFILESREHLANIESQLLALEQNPGNAEAINAVFRGFHTVKSLAGLLDFISIQNFTHDL